MHLCFFCIIVYMCTLARKENRAKGTLLSVAEPDQTQAKQRWRTAALSSAMSNRMASSGQAAPARQVPDGKPDIQVIRVPGMSHHQACT